MDMMKMMKEAMAMRSRLAEMDKQLKDRVIETELDGVKVVTNAKSEIRDIKISPEVFKQPHEKAEKAVLAALQSAVKRSQEVMAEEAKKLTGGVKIPGLM
jgi:DNA-binding protein YbaB